MSDDLPSVDAMHELPLGRRSARAPNDDLAVVIGELASAVPITLADLTELEHLCKWCFAAHRVELAQLFLSRARNRAVLVFHAPDAESVRLACRHAAVPVERIWTCLNDGNLGKP